MKKIIHKNKWFSLEKHNFNNKGNYYFLNKRPTVFIIAESNERKIICIKEFRYPIGKSIWQLPAGMVDDDNPLSSAKKELLEETGYKAGHWERLGYFFVAPGHENTKIITFIAKDLTKSNDNESVDLEKNIKEMSFFSKNEIINMIKRNEIECGISLAALNFYFSM